MVEDPIRAVRNGAEILVTYAVVRVLLRDRPIDQVVATLRRGHHPSPRATTAALAEARRLAGAVDAVVGRLPLESRCLVRSLVLTRLLHRRGYRTEFVLSAWSGDGFGAHAWVEWLRSPLLPPGVGQVEFLRL